MIKKNVKSNNKRKNKLPSSDYGTGVSDPLKAAKIKGSIVITRKVK